MPASRASRLAALLLLCATSLCGAAVQADPHDLYASASRRLAKGDLKGAETAIARLHAVIASGPGWDPGGLFTKELLPPLEARLRRLQKVAAALDDFESRAVAQLQRPDPVKDTATVKDYTTWATSVIRDLRAERDRIVTSGLASQEERALMARTESYARTQQLLETDLLKKVADASGDDIIGLLAGDPKMDSVLLRFRQLKQELMKTVADRDQARARIAGSDEREEILLRAMSALVTEGAALDGAKGRGSTAAVSEQFDRFLDAEISTVRAKTALTPVERALLRADVERYRRYKSALAAAGLHVDRRGKVGILGRIVGALPITGKDAAPPPAGNRIFMVISGALALLSGVLAWLALDRGRRLAAAMHSLDDTLPGLVAGGHSADTRPDDADRDAA
jgi:hypothetical protein